MYQIEFLGPGQIELTGLGDMKPKKKYKCCKAIADEFEADDRFRVYRPEKKKGVKNAG